ncbi:hypothetical protein Tco_0683165 [Tanacetum coccineum]|uniref:Uncharacterized protein n=1 Tax=Tanacetum coccineum TaxID=301880 RepID=A0ABQ4XUB0_9ASTR
MLPHPTPPLRVSSSPLPLPSPLTTSPTDAGAPLGYRAAGIRMRVAAASPPLSLLPTSPRTDVPEAEMSPQKRSCHYFSALGHEYGACIPTTLESGVNQRGTELDIAVSFEERSSAIEAHVRTLEAQVATLITQTTSLQTQLTTALGRIATLEVETCAQDGPVRLRQQLLVMYHL